MWGYYQFTSVSNKEISPYLCIHCPSPHLMQYLGYGCLPIVVYTFAITHLIESFVQSQIQKWTISLSKSSSYKIVIESLVAPRKIRVTIYRPLEMNSIRASYSSECMRLILRVPNYEMRPWHLVFFIVHLYLGVYCTCIAFTVQLM